MLWRFDMQDIAGQCFEAEHDHLYDVKDRDAQTTNLKSDAGRLAGSNM